MELNSNIVVFEVFEDLFMFPWLFRKFCHNDKIPVFDCWVVKRRMRNSRKHCRDSLEPKRLRIRNTKNNVFFPNDTGLWCYINKRTAKSYVLPYWMSSCVYQPSLYMFGFDLVFVRGTLAPTPFSTLYNCIPSFFSCYGLFWTLGWNSLKTVDTCIA